MSIALTTVLVVAALIPSIAFLNSYYVGQFPRLYGRTEKSRRRVAMATYVRLDAALSEEDGRTPAELTTAPEPDRHVVNEVRLALAERVLSSATARQKIIVGGLLEGVTAKTIAEAAGISLPTVWHDLWMLRRRAEALARGRGVLPLRRIKAMGRRAAGRAA